MRPISTALAFILLTAPAAAFGQEIVVTGGSAPSNENPESIRLREAAAYATPLPAGAPEADFALVAWCEAMARGHAALGESLAEIDDLDRELIELGRTEATSFHRALNIARAKQDDETLAAAEAAVEAVEARWAPVMERDNFERSQAFGLFIGLPGRCEHAARRLRAGITDAPAALPETARAD